MRSRWILLLLVAIVSLAGAGYFLRRGRSEPGPPPVQGNRLFQTVMRYVRSESVDSLSEEELYRLAASGVISELEDPYAVLILPGQRRSADPDADPPLGLHLERRDGALVVVGTVPGSPADRAGVQSGDLLFAVENTSVEPEDLEAMGEVLDGPAGSRVLLRLRRSGRGPLTIEVPRGPVPRVPSLTSELLDGGIGWIRIARVGPRVTDSLARAVERLRASGMRGLILDLRRSVGGALPDAVAAADLFLDDRIVLAATRGRSPADSMRFVDSTPARFPDLPLVVLVDQGTAGGAEALAGALQDHDRAAVLGMPTFGRGVTQRRFPLGAGASLQLTTALWLTPSGRQIQTPPRPEDGDSVPRPRVKSDAGRTLLGGGGIVPHQQVRDSGAVDRSLVAALALLERARTPGSVLARVPPT
ncbi:MAG: S41 family peptidase [Gemmatimonadales bacterium]